MSKIITGAQKNQEFVLNFKTPDIRYLIQGQPITTTADADFNLGTSEFTIDAWVTPVWSGTFCMLMLDTDNYLQIWSGGSGSVGMDIVEAGSPLFAVTWNRSEPSIDTIGWSHYEFSRQSDGFITLRINGILMESIDTGNPEIGVGTVIPNFSGATFNIGDGIVNGSFTGNLDDFHFSKGIVRHTADFNPLLLSYTPDSFSKVLLTFDDGLLTDSSASNHTFTTIYGGQYPVADFKTRVSKDGGQFNVPSNSLVRIENSTDKRGSVRTYNLTLTASEMNADRIIVQEVDNFIQPIDILTEIYTGSGGSGASAADVWAYSSRTLTSSGALSMSLALTNFMVKAISGGYNLTNVEMGNEGFNYFQFVDKTGKWQQVKESVDLTTTRYAANNPNKMTSTVAWSTRTELGYSTEADI